MTEPHLPLLRETYTARQISACDADTDTLRLTEVTLKLVGETATNLICRGGNSLVLYLLNLSSLNVYSYFYYYAIHLFCRFVLYFRLILGYLCCF